MANVHGTIGGDAELSPRGEQYALKLPELVAKSVAVSVKLSNLSEVPQLIHTGRSNTHCMDVDIEKNNRNRKTSTCKLQPTSMESPGRAGFRGLRQHDLQRNSRAIPRRL